MSGVSNIYLLKTLKDDLKCSDTFIGVFSADNWDIEKSLERERFIAICNLSKESEIGSHFVTVVADPKQLLYIDSFALPTTMSVALYNTLKKVKKRKIKRLLKQPIQANSSEYCGFFCMLFTCLFDVERFPNMNDLKPFNKQNLHKNDEICIINLKKLIQQN